MANTATITLDNGPDISSGGKVLSNVSSVLFDFDRSVLFVTSGGKTYDFDYYAATTITLTKSGQNNALTVTLTP